ncbi:MAG: hypothetical protein ACXIUZ_00700 [Lysobacteraceae bacterium]
MKWVYEDTEIFVPLDEQDEGGEVAEQLGIEMTEFIGMAGLDTLGHVMEFVFEACRDMMRPPPDVLVAALVAYRANPTPQAFACRRGVWVNIQVRKRGRPYCPAQPSMPAPGPTPVKRSAAPAPAPRVSRRQTLFPTLKPSWA